LKVWKKVSDDEYHTKVFGKEKEKEKEKRGEQFLYP